MSQSAACVPASRVRRILANVQELHDIADHHTRLMHAVTGICGVVGADVGALFVFTSPESPKPDAGFIHGYSPGQTQAVLAEYASQGVDFDLVAARLRGQFRGAGHVVARRRRDLLGDRAWYNSPFFSDSRRRWGVDDCIYSLQGLGQASFGLGLNRSFGSTPFSDADCSLIEIFNVAIAEAARDSLLPRAATARELRRDSLPPRARQILDGLLRGETDKNIAEQLGISPNTVHHYCKLVFRIFDVESRGELIARWFGAACR